MEDNKGIINPGPYFSNKYINVSISPKQGYGFPAYINRLEIVDANAIINSKTHILVSGAEYRYDTGVDILDQIILYCKYVDQCESENQLIETKPRVVRFRSVGPIAVEHGSNESKVPVFNRAEVLIDDRFVDFKDLSINQSITESINVSHDYNGPTYIIGNNHFKVRFRI